MPVVVNNELGENRDEMAAIEDQHPIEAFPARSSYEALREPSSPAAPGPGS